MIQTEVNYTELARKAAGNHRRFSCFVWFGRPQDDENWTIVYTHNHDSRLLEVSNGVAIGNALDLFSYGSSPTVLCQDHSHWGCGWVHAYVIRVYTRRGKITKAFRAWCDLQEKLEDYPILDERDYYEREYDAAISAIEQEGRRLVKSDAPKNWAAKVYGWLGEYAESELENRDDDGAYPSPESVREALNNLGLLDTTNI